jgi:hypothetical protein
MAGRGGGRAMKWAIWVMLFIVPLPLLVLNSFTQGKEFIASLVLLLGYGVVLAYAGLKIEEGGR